MQLQLFSLIRGEREAPRRKAVSSVLIPLLTHKVEQATSLIRTKIPYYCVSFRKRESILYKTNPKQLQYGVN